MADEPLPSEYTFGKVISRFLSAIPDTPSDPDYLPQARPLQGTVTFVPTEQLRKVSDTGDGTGAFIYAITTVAQLDNEGRIMDEEGRQGIWLITGEYTVSFQMSQPSAKIAPFVITVLDTHDDANPLDLVSVAP